MKFRTRRSPIAVLLGIATLVPAAAQESWYPKHNFRVGAGFARPRGDIGGLLGDAPSFTVGYGYRFHRNFQADVGFDMAAGAAGTRDFLETSFGPLRIRDYQFFVPFGGRAILPILGERLWISGGGGGAFLTYRERVRQPGDYVRIDCPPCASRNGWGYYGLVNVGTALGRTQMFRVGVTAKMYRTHTDGDPFGFIPGFRTRDRWFLLGGEFGVSF